jgi:hypothetical protein
VRYSPPRECRHGRLRAPCGSFGDRVGKFTSATIGQDGLGLISYWDVANGRLKVAHCNDLDCSTATKTTIDSTGDVGGYTSITIGSDGLGLISYYSFSGQELKVAHCADLDCSLATSFLGVSGSGANAFPAITSGRSSGGRPVQQPALRQLLPPVLTRTTGPASRRPLPSLHATAERRILRKTAITEEGSFMFKGKRWRSALLAVGFVMLVLATATALAGSGVGGVFNLGQTNSVNATSTLTGGVGGPQLKVANTGAGSAILATQSSSTASAVDGRHLAVGGAGAGVRGQSSSSTGAGVLGVNTQAAPVSRPL